MLARARRWSASRIRPSSSGSRRSTAMKAGITSFRSRSTRKCSARFRCPLLRAKNAVRTTASMSASGSGKRLPKGASPKGPPGAVGVWGKSWAPSSWTVLKTSSPASSDGNRTPRGITESLPFRGREPGTVRDDPSRTVLPVPPPPVPFRLQFRVFTIILIGPFRPTSS